MSYDDEMVRVANWCHVVVDIAPPARTDGLGAEVCLVLLDPISGRLIVGSKRDYPRGCSRLLTGGIKPGESPKRAALREAMEEVGLVPTQLAELGRIIYGARQERKFTTVLVTGDIATESDISPASDELTETMLIDVSQLAEVAHSLDHLPSTPHRNTTWAEWGSFRAISHRIVLNLLQQNGMGANREQR